MENQNKEIVKTLNDLIEVNYDRSKGYQTAADEMEDTEYKSKFTQYSSQSSSYKNELEGLVRQFGGEPTKSSSASGTVYRAWMETKAALTGKDKKAILSSCEFGEDAAKKTYNEAKSKSTAFPPNVQTVIARQHDEILRAHDTIKRLRDSFVEHPH
jgi:uncharacterized protein (TIGR02284 family)